MSSTNTLYEQYKQQSIQRTHLESAAAVLSWDKEVYMPKEGAANRTQQIATLMSMAHELFTGNEFSDTLAELEQQKEQLPQDARRNVELSSHSHRRMRALDTDFVRRSSIVSSNAYHAWLKAREANDFSLFKKELGEVVQLKREEAERLGYEDHPYDALLEEFEPGYTAAMLDTLFADVKAKLVDLVQEIRAQQQVKDDFLYQTFDTQAQWDASLDLLRKIGYNFDAGRQDWSPHPFTINFSPKDVRVTTRVDENDLNNLLWSSLHEGGHALYEQGLPEKHYGLPIGRHVSLGIHESQSRLWENNVGRSLPFWRAHYSTLQSYFLQLKNVSVEAFYKAINTIKTGLIRTEADELHYHFHVLIRYELEKALLEGNLEVADLSTAWNDAYKKYLNVDVPDDKQGVLQDIHWAYGSIGYFPTYSLGSFYAAQFYQQAEKEINNLEAEIEKGNTQPLLTWLQQNIYSQGRTYDANELCQKLTGETLNFDYFYQYAQKKYRAIYFE
ncbi:MAG: carboxypeptidase M32 [Bacteroidota bacterium]